MSTVLTDIDAKKNIAKHVNKLLDATGMSRATLSKKIGEPRMQITRICQGSHMPNVLIIAKIADVFNVSIDFLLSDE